MKLVLNKYDIIITIIIFIVVIVNIVLIFLTNDNQKDKKALVFFQNNLVHTIDLNKPELQEYSVEATNGLVKIEAKDGKVRVVDETSKHNICSIQGWSDSTINPIVCLPNNLYIKIENADNVEEEVDVYLR